MLVTVTLHYRYFVPAGLAERADVPVLVVLGGRGLPGWITTDFQEFAARAAFRGLKAAARRSVGGWRSQLDWGS